VTDVSAAKRRQLRGQAEEAGVRIIGLHWLLARTEGLHLTSDDSTIRAKTADYLIELARCCRDLGGDLMVFGSPAQRRIPVGATPEHAAEYAADTFRRAMPAVADCGVQICLEPLAPAETDFLTTCAEAVALLDRVAHPKLVLHLDVKAMSSEETAVPDLIRRHAARTGHFHANDPNRRGPGFGDTDFAPIFRALRQSGYSGWVSVEVFDYSPDPETIALESMRYLKACEARVASS
jgi:sugar phosphate isomerase/epimerase